jgi:transposase
MERKRYPSDLTIHEWKILESLIPPCKTGGRPRSVDMLEIVNGMFYVLKTGCAWEFMPHDLPNHKTVFYYFNEWSEQKILEKFNDELVKQTRLKAGKKAVPTVGIVDSQTVKGTEKKGVKVMMLVKKLMELKNT